MLEPDQNSNQRCCIFGHSSQWEYGIVKRLLPKMVHSRFQRILVDSHLELESVVFCHLPILQRVLENFGSDDILASPVMILEWVNFDRSCKRLQSVQYFFIKWGIAYIQIWETAQFSNFFVQQFFEKSRSFSKNWIIKWKGKDWVFSPTLTMRPSIYTSMCWVLLPTP